MRSSIVAIALVVLFNSTCFASTKTLYPTNDAHIYSTGPGGVGDKTYLGVGYDPASGNYRTLLKFDLSSIPANSTINSAYLNCDYYTSSGTNAARTTGAYRITSDWSQGTVTWNNNYNSSAISTISLGGSPRLVTWDITALVRLWCQRPCRHGAAIAVGNAR